MSLLTTTLATETSFSQAQDASPLRCDSERFNGRWTKEEHHRFVEAIKFHGKNWKKVEESVGSRTGAQIRSHAQKYFLKIEKEVKTSQKTKVTKKSSKKASEGSISTLDNISESGKSDNSLKGNLPFTEICENLTEASENVVALPITSENLATEKKFVDVSNLAAKSNEMQLETTIDYSKLSKAQLLAKLKACEEKVDSFHKVVSNFTAAQTTDTDTTTLKNPLLGKSYHHFVYLDLMSYFGVFNKTVKSLKISDFVDLSYKTSTMEDSYEIPAGKKKVKIL
jgi:SHAQKYF class myb-like DNA-binding protein